ncbi:MAG: hypothetical protein ACRDJ4_11145 [Actinomycetota bacterium]
MNGGGDRRAEREARRVRIANLIHAIGQKDEGRIKSVLAEEDDLADMVVGIGSLSVHLLELYAEEAGVDPDSVLRHLGLPVQGPRSEPPTELEDLPEFE